MIVDIPQCSELPDSFYDLLDKTAKSDTDEIIIQSIMHLSTHHQFSHLTFDEVYHKLIESAKKNPIMLSIP